MKKILLTLGLVCALVNTSFADAPTLWRRSGFDITNTNAAIGNVGIGTALPVNLFEVGARYADVTSTGNVGIATINPRSLLEVGKLNVFSGGNIGINSTNPGALLDIAGTIRATSYAGVNFVPTNIQTFTSNGTWTKPANVSKVYVRAWGPGGSGSTSAGNGAGGAADTTFAGTVTLTAGLGGAGNNPNGGSGGSCTNADFATPALNGNSATVSSPQLPNAPFLFGTNTYRGAGGAGFASKGSGGTGAYCEGFIGVTGNVTIVVGTGGASTGAGSVKGEDGAVIVAY